MDAMLVEPKTRPSPRSGFFKRFTREAEKHQAGNKFAKFGQEVALTDLVKEAKKDPTQTYPALRLYQVLTSDMPYPDKQKIVHALVQQFHEDAKYNGKTYLEFCWENVRNQDSENNSTDQVSYLQIWQHWHTYHDQNRRALEQSTIAALWRNFCNLNQEKFATLGVKLPITIEDFENKEINLLPRLKSEDPTAFEHFFETPLSTVLARHNAQRKVQETPAQVQARIEALLTQPKISKMVEASALNQLHQNPNPEQIRRITGEIVRLATVYLETTGRKNFEAEFLPHMVHPSRSEDPNLLLKMIGDANWIQKKLPLLDITVQAAFNEIFANSELDPQFIAEEKIYIYYALRGYIKAVNIRSFSESEIYRGIASKRDNAHGTETKNSIEIRKSVDDRITQLIKDIYERHQRGPRLKLNP